MLYYEEHAYTLDAESISCLKMHRPPKLCAKPRPLEAEAGVLGGRSDLETTDGWSRMVCPILDKNRGKPTIQHYTCVNLPPYSQGTEEHPCRTKYQGPYT